MQQNILKRSRIDAADSRIYDVQQNILGFDFFYLKIGMKAFVKRLNFYCFREVRKSVDVQQEDTRCTESCWNIAPDAGENHGGVCDPRWVLEIGCQSSMYGEDLKHQDDLCITFLAPY